MPDPPFIWAYTSGNLSTARSNHTATLLPDGKVLVAGGYAGGGVYVSSAELYDPDTGVFNATGSMASARIYHTATLLPNGKVLVAGGQGLNGFFATVELYDPATGAWTPTGSLSQARINHTATLLPNGKVLVAGGLEYVYGHYRGIDSAEIYDPNTGAWSPAGSLNHARGNHSATLLDNGKVLVAGGRDYNNDESLSELYDPRSDDWSSCDWGESCDMRQARDSHTAVLLPNGKVLIAGGYAGSEATETVETYNPQTRSFTWPNHFENFLKICRVGQVGVLLSNGKVLMAAGDGFVGSSEIYDPAAETSTSAGNLKEGRTGHTVTLLNSGQVLVTGGQGVGYTSLSSAEIGKKK